MNTANNNMRQSLAQQIERFDEDYEVSQENMDRFYSLASVVAPSMSYADAVKENVIFVKREVPPADDRLETTSEPSGVDATLRVNTGLFLLHGETLRAFAMAIRGADQLIIDLEEDGTVSVHVTVAYVMQMR
jgi:hypothetical protein